MKKFAALTTIAALAMAPAAFAGDKSFADIDTDADGFLSLSEIQVVKPEVTADDVAAYDTDGDTMLSEAEFEAWKMAKKEDKDMEEKSDSDY